MGIFDIDSGTDNHLLNEQFHVFSKSPASVATALGDASNRSGHTVTASDVWGQEIPAFFYAKTQAVADTYKALAKTNDLCRIGNSVAIFENGNWAVKYNSYTDIPDGHKFKNANGDEVIRFHKNRLAYNLNLDNNAADDGLNTTAKIQGWDEENKKVYDYVATAPKFVTQFVTSTDKIVDGIPSKGFGPFVMAGTTTGDITKVLPEGTSDPNHYIANSFAGIIQFNQARTDAIYVHAFEYCGKTLKSAYSDIVELDEKLSKISVTASGGVQDASTEAKAAGFSVTTEKRTDSEGKEETIPVITIETGSVTTGVTKLVTGGAVAAVTDALAGRISALEGVKLSVQVVDALPATPVINTLYLVPEEGKTSGNYVEYIAYKPEGSETVTTERIGTTAVDLEGYTTDAEHTALAERVTALDAATTGRVAVVEGKVKTLEDTTIPAVQQSVTDLTKTVGDNKTAIEKALADAKTEIGTTTSGLDTRLQTAEGKVSTLEGQVATITSTDATKEGSIAKALADAKTYAEGQASAAEAAAKSEASTNLAAAVEQIGKDIASAKQDAISSSTVTLNQSTTNTGILVTPNGTAANVFEIGIDKSIIATAASVSALSQTVASNKTELEGKITAAKEEISATTDALAADIQSIKDVIGEGDNGENIIDILSGIRTDLNATTTTANSAAQSAKGDTYVSASQSGTKITVETNIANITSYVDTELVKSGTAVATAINAAKEAGVAAGNAASQALATAKTQTLEQTGTLNNMFTVKTAGTVGTGITSITIMDAGLSKTISDAESNAVTTALGSTITSVTAKDVETSPKVTVTLSGTVQTPVLQVVTNDIASAQELAELKQTVTDKNVTTTTAAQTVGVTATGNAIDVATATYTPATADAAGSWSNEAKLVTGTDVKEAIADINSKIDTLHSAAVTYQVFATLPTATAEHKGMVALVPANSGDSAVAGTYVEYLCVESVSGDTKTYSW